MGASSGTTHELKPTFGCFNDLPSFSKELLALGSYVEDSTTVNLGLKLDHQFGHRVFLGLQLIGSAHNKSLIKAVHCSTQKH